MLIIKIIKFWVVTAVFLLLLAPYLSGAADLNSANIPALLRAFDGDNRNLLEIIPVGANPLYYGNRYGLFVLITNIPLFRDEALRFAFTDGKNVASIKTSSAIAAESKNKVPRVSAFNLLVSLKEFDSLKQEKTNLIVTDERGKKTIVQGVFRSLFEKTVGYWERTRDGYKFKSTHKIIPINEPGIFTLAKKVTSSKLPALGFQAPHNGIAKLTLFLQKDNTTIAETDPFIITSPNTIQFNLDAGGLRRDKYNLLARAEAVNEEFAPINVYIALPPASRFAELLNQLIGGIVPKQESERVYKHIKRYRYIDPATKKAAAWEVFGAGYSATEAACKAVENADARRNTLAKRGITIFFTGEYQELSATVEKGTPPGTVSINWKTDASGEYNYELCVTVKGKQNHLAPQSGSLKTVGDIADVLEKNGFINNEQANQVKEKGLDGLKDYEIGINWVLPQPLPEQ